jgi:hypothetical protein
MEREKCEGTERCWCKPEPCDPSKFPTCECDCEDCQSMCARPCWPTPAEADAIILAGYGSTLTLTAWYGCSDHGDIDVARPRTIEEWCVFLDEGRCALHDRGLKPIEGRVATHKDRPEGYPSGDIHEHIAAMWDTDEGRRVVASVRRMEDDGTPEA